MKFSLFKNDKSTYLDELFLALFIIVTAGCGVALFIIVSVNPKLGQLLIEF